MRLPLVLLAYSLTLCAANAEPYDASSKPISAAAVASAKADGNKPVLKEAAKESPRTAAAMRAKDEQAADILAARIATRLAAVRAAPFERQASAAGRAALPAKSSQPQRALAAPRPASRRTAWLSSFAAPAPAQ